MRKLTAIGAFTAAVPVSLAHCPLCTAGAVVAASGAAYLGMQVGGIGVFIGAFAAATGLWFASAMKWHNQWLRAAIALASFALTVLPTRMMLSRSVPLYIAWIGRYGTTLSVDLYLSGALVGLAIMSAGPMLSKQVSRILHLHLPFQGIALTFALLLVAAVLFQVI